MARSSSNAPGSGSGHADRAASETWRDPSSCPYGVQLCRSPTQGQIGDEARGGAVAGHRRTIRPDGVGRQPPGYPAGMETTIRAYGAQSMTAPLVEVLVKRPGPAFGRAFDDPANGFLRPVDLEVARREHDAFTELLASLGPTVHELDIETDSPDLVYQFDPLLVSDQGAIPLRPGKPGRVGEELVIEAWLNDRGVPTVARIEAPGTIEGGDTFWLRPDILCVGRSLRTNGEGARQLDAIVPGDVRVFDLPYWKGPAELVHLLSVISPVADDLAVVYPPLLPVGLWQLLDDLEIELIEVPRRRVPDARLQRPRRSTRGGHHRRGQPADRRGPGPGRLRGPHLSGDRDRTERLGRADLPDPTDPARYDRMTRVGTDVGGPGVLLATEPPRRDVRRARAGGPRRRRHRVLPRPGAPGRRSGPRARLRDRPGDRPAGRGRPLDRRARSLPPDARRGRGTAPGAPRGRPASAPLRRGGHGRLPAGTPVRARLRRLPGVHGPARPGQPAGGAGDDPTPPPTGRAAGPRPVRPTSRPPGRSVAVRSARSTRVRIR